MATITEDYVSFETAKLLKEKGFEEECMYFYDWDEEDEIYRICSNGGSCNEARFPSCYSMPTLQMACRWLTAAHNLFIAFELDFSDGAYPMFDAVVYNLATCEKYPIINYDRYSYIKGTEAAIKYCLEHLI